jgi:hypothetical protein
MSELGGETAKLVTATANRLRLVQTDLADEAPEVRQQYLGDELERALAQVVPADRAAFIAALPSTDMRELNDASFLVERLTDLAPSLSDSERQSLAARLRDAGLSASGRQVWPETNADKLRAHLKLSEGPDLDPGRCLDLLQMELEFCLSLDQLVWSTWKALAPRSDIRGSGDLRNTIGPFLQGNPDVARGEAMMHLEKLRQLTAAIVSAISQTGRQFAQTHHAKFNPDAIEDAAKGDKKALESIGVAAWRKYREITGTSDQATIEREIMQLIADYADRLMKGLSR